MIAGNDPEALCPQLKQAMAKGIAVVTFDSDVNCRQLFINQADTETIGRSQIQLLGKEMGYKGEFAILSAASTATNQNAWIKYMKMELKKPEYKNMKLVKIYYGNDNPAQSLQATESMLQAYPNLKGIESPTTVGISSAAQYLSTTRSTRARSCSPGLGLPSQMKKYVLDGTVKEFALWNPEDLGYLAGYARRGDRLGRHQGQGRRDVQAGKLGKYTIIKRRRRAAGRSSGRRSCSTRRTSRSSTSRRSAVRAAGAGGAPAPSVETAHAQRICFQLQVQPDRIAEYRGAARRGLARDARRALGGRLAQLLAVPRRHRDRDRRTSRCDDFDAAGRAMEKTEVNARWQPRWPTFFEGLEGRRPDEGLLPPRRDLPP